MKYKLVYSIWIHVIISIGLSWLVWWLSFGVLDNSFIEKDYPILFWFMALPLILFGTAFGFASLFMFVARCDSDMDTNEPQTWQMLLVHWKMWPDPGKLKCDKGKFFPRYPNEL